MMRTYSKRHRTVHQNALNDAVVYDQTTRKRVNLSEPEGQFRKRKKLVDRLAMFETPHPTLEANSQVYKLPSTKPVPSSTPFSPVPITAPAPRLRSYFVPPTSGILKENVGSSKSSRRRQSSKTLSSFTLTSGSGYPPRNTRENSKQARSPSRSSNSSRSRSRDETKHSKSKSKLLKKFKFKLNSTINDLGQHQKSNRYISVPNAQQSLLDSPFASRVPSPTDHSNLDNAKSSLHEAIERPILAEITLGTHIRGPSKVQVHPNAPSHTRPRNQYFKSKKCYPSQSCDAFSSPEKPGTRKRVSATFDQGPVRTNKNDVSWKSRRPSAPSNLQRPPKPVQARIPLKMIDHKHLKGESSHTSELWKPSPSCSIGRIKDSDIKLNAKLDDDVDPLSWMQERSVVDFNRPPSQISLHMSSGFDVEAGVFWSSAEEDEDDNFQRLGTNIGATNFAWLTSTPHEKAISRSSSVPILELSSNPQDVKARSLSMDASSYTRISSSVRHDDKSGDNMELTAPLESGGNPENFERDSPSLEEHTPWITDSIISPPSAYSERKKHAVSVEKIEEDAEKEPPASAESGFNPSNSLTEKLSSPFGSSCADSSSSIVESASVTLEESMVYGKQEHKEGGTVAPAIQRRSTSQRTRSGTILAARNGVSIARRTRTGTIVGPSAIGRTRSGTIIAKVKVPEHKSTGSVIDPVPSGEKEVRSRTGSVSKVKPTKSFNTAGPEEEVARVDDQSTQIENTSNNGCGCSIRNEAEFYVDSLYLTSSPDPINFLTGAEIDGDESTLVVPVGEWQVTAEPPSPEIRRTKKTILTPRGVGVRSSARFLKPKGNQKNRARFLGADGQVENDEFDDPIEDMSDDELLLVEGQSQSLFN